MGGGEVIEVVIGIVCGYMLATALYVCKQIRVVSTDLDNARNVAEKLRDELDRCKGGWVGYKKRMLPWEVEK